MQPAGLNQLRDDEADGGRPNLVVYDDATGAPIRPGSVVTWHPTIGVGRALATHGISPLEAERLFSADVSAAELGVLAIWPWSSALDAVRRDALTNMAFQLGAHGLAQFVHMGAALQAGDWLRAHDAALDSAWARELAAFGSTRARRIAAQLLTGDADARP